MSFAATVEERDVRRVGPLARLALAVIAALAMSVLFMALSQPAQAQAGDYQIHVNRQQNVMTIYARDSSGNYTVPVKAILCATGKNYSSPAGWSTISDRMVWHQLNGGVWGQYCSRYGTYDQHVLIHSVYYYQGYNKGSISERRYNMLGSQASDGCINVCVLDAKWIYDNCPSGTAVYVYDSADPGPLGKPGHYWLDEDRNWGWDPTDPDPSNPYYSNLNGYWIDVPAGKAIGIGESINLPVKYDCSSGAPSTFAKQLKWSSNNYGVATVDQNGNVTGVGKGTARISATLPNETRTATYDIIVGADVESVTISFSSSLVVGQSAVIPRTVLPAIAWDPSLTWKSSNTSVATVDANGRVTAKGAGTATITASSKPAASKGGVAKTSSCKVKVVQPKVIYVDYDDSTIKTQTVNYGDKLKYPTMPAKVEYKGQTLVFMGWDKSYKPSTWTLTCMANYENEANISTASADEPAKLTTAAADAVKSGAKVVTTGGAGALTPQASPEKAKVRNLTAATYSFMGVDRYMTSSLGATNIYASAPSAIIAWGGEPYDALASSGLSSFTNAPVLITPNNQLKWETYWALAVLDTTKVTIVGGTPSVSAGVSNSIKSVLKENCDKGQTAKVTRIAGSNRIETANLIAKSHLPAYSSDNWGKTAILTTSQGAYDAASAAPYSVAAKAPIVLGDRTGGLTDGTLALLKEGGFTRVIVAGDTPSISKAAENKLKAEGFSVKRVYGKNRYTTSAAFAKWSANQTAALSWDKVAVATGKSFTDALVAAPAQGALGGVLVLATDGAGGTPFLDTYQASSVKTTLFYGDYNALSQSLRDIILAKG